MRLLFILTIALASACGTTKDTMGTKSEDQAASAKDVSKVQKPVVEMGYEEKSDPYNLLSASVDGKKLKLKVQYGGGCEEHAFELYTNGMIMKSLPPKQRFFLRHYNHGDSCKGLKTKDLVYDLSETTVTGNSLIIMLDGYDGVLKMDF